MLPRCLLSTISALVLLCSSGSLSAATYTLQILPEVTKITAGSSVKLVAQDFPVNIVTSQGWMDSQGHWSLDRIVPGVTLSISDLTPDKKPRVRVDISPSVPIGTIFNVYFDAAPTFAMGTAYPEQYGKATIDVSDQSCPEGTTVIRNIGKVLKKGKMADVNLITCGTKENEIQLTPQLTYVQPSWYTLGLSSVLFTVKGLQYGDAMNATWSVVGNGYVASNRGLVNNHNAVNLVFVTTAAQPGEVIHVYVDFPKVARLAGYRGHARIIVGPPVECKTDASGNRLVESTTSPHACIPANIPTATSQISYCSANLGITSCANTCVSSSGGLLPVDSQGNCPYGQQAQNINCNFLNPPNVQPNDITQHAYQCFGPGASNCGPGSIVSTFYPLGFIGLTPTGPVPSFDQGNEKDNQWGNWGLAKVVSGSVTLTAHAFGQGDVTHVYYFREPVPGEATSTLLGEGTKYLGYSSPFSTLDFLLQPDNNIYRQVIGLPEANNYYSASFQAGSWPNSDGSLGSTGAGQWIVSAVAVDSQGNRSKIAQITVVGNQYTFNYGGSIQNRGISDLITFSNGLVQMHRGDGAGNFTRVQANVGAASVFARGDFQLLGRQGLFAYNVLSGSASITTNNADGTATPMFIYGLAAGYTQAVAGDWNGDGLDDLALYNASTGQLTIGYANGETPDYSGFDWYSQTIMTGGSQLLTGDYTGTQVGGLFLYRSSDGASQMLVSNLNGTFTGTAYSLQSGAMLATGDINGDFKDDIYAYSPTYGAAAGLMSTAGSTYTWFASANLPASGTQVLLGDMNNDGKADLVFVHGSTSSQSYNSYIVMGMGDGQYASTVINTGNCNASSTTCSSNNFFGNVVLGDFNGDGRTDVFSAPYGQGYGYTYLASGFFGNQYYNYWAQGSLAFYGNLPTSATLIPVK